MNTVLFFLCCFLVIVLWGSAMILMIRTWSENVSEKIIKEMFETMDKPNKEVL